MMARQKLSLNLGFDHYSLAPIVSCIDRAARTTQDSTSCRHDRASKKAASQDSKELNCVCCASQFVALGIARK
eukprot:576606-Amphidinium_carterae.1